MVGKQLGTRTIQLISEGRRILMQTEKDKRNETDNEASRRWDNEGGHFEEQSLQQWPATSATGSSDASSTVSESGRRAESAAAHEKSHTQREENRAQSRKKVE